MRLNELTGVKRYKDRSIWDVLSDMAKHGGFSGHGRFSTVIGNQGWNYVYKVFASDHCYMQFLDYAIEHPSPSVPKFYGKPRLLTPFYSRSRAADQVYVVKMERLYPIDRDSTLPRMIEDGVIYLDYLSHPDPELRARYEAVLAKKSEIEALRDQKDWVAYRQAVRAFDEEKRNLYPYPHVLPLEDACAENPSLLPAIRAWNDMVQHVECAPDLHSENVMTRKDGTLVLTDPFWHGSNPYMDYDAAMRAETDTWGEDDVEMVRGSERFKPKPVHKYTPPPQSDDDIPF